MITVRQLERLWQEKAFDRMSRLLLEMRPESSVRLASDLSRSVPAAALALIRLDELSQSHSSLCPRLIRHILASQEPDGGWGDALTTALCVRALSCGRGGGPALTRGIEFLANLQKDDGSWPRVPLRRLPGDAFTTALVLFHLGENDRFATLADCEKAVAWLTSQEADLDTETQQLCRRLHLRMAQHAAEEPSFSWS